MNMNKKNRVPLLVLFTIIGIGAGFLLFSAWASSSDSEPVAATEELPAPAAPVEPEVPRQFGLSLDSFDVLTETVKRNEFLSNILQRYRIDLADISVLSQKAKEVYDVRKIAAGKPYAIFASKDDPSRAAYFVYQPNPIDYVVYDLRDSMRVYTGKHEVTTRMRSVSGIITSSLYETFEEGGANPALSMQFAGIYAWVVDFYSIQRDDWFKVQYEQQYVLDEPVGPGHITSAVFSHDGKEFQAFYFQPDTSEAGEYYNEEGESLRRAFLKAPLKYSRITSRYSKRRFHPVQKRWKAHLGTDYAAPAGTPIIATANGTVTESRYTKYNGNYVKIRHNGTYTTQYLHMSRRAVRPGQHVSQGQVIGYVGSTGLATGPHVCYRFWKNGQQVDALKQDFPPAEPVAEAFRATFDRMVRAQQEELALMAPHPEEEGSEEVTANTPSETAPVPL